MTIDPNLLPRVSFHLTLNDNHRCSAYSRPPQYANGRRAGGSVLPPMNNSSMMATYNFFTYCIFESISLCFPEDSVNKDGFIFVPVGDQPDLTKLGDRYDILIPKPKNLTFKVFGFTDKYTAEKIENKQRK